MTQNTSHAVMAQRHEPDDSLEFFPTPLWATRALCEHVLSVAGSVVWEPACGEGSMARALAEYAGAVIASDVHPYGYGHVNDFLFPGGTPLLCDHVVTNPPFRLAEQFIKRGLEVATQSVAMLVRSVFIESIGRYENIFLPHPPQIMAQFVERVPIVKGRLDPKASTATSYCWLVWYVGSKENRTRLLWIPPSRAKLERPGDYPE